MSRTVTLASPPRPRRRHEIGGGSVLASGTTLMETEKVRKLLALSGFGVVTAGAALFASQFRPGSWYRGLRKPWFQPPAWVIAPVWTVLYTLIAASGYRMWSAPPSGERTKALGLWGAQLGLNAAWTWLFFGKRDPKAALVDIGLLRLAIHGYSEAARNVAPDADWMIAPYRGWVSFATLLNTEIVRQNA
jgi:benzodiazapine receptor